MASDTLNPGATTTSIPCAASAANAFGPQCPATRQSTLRRAIVSAAFGPAPEAWLVPSFSIASRSPVVVSTMRNHGARPKRSSTMLEGSFPPAATAILMVSSSVAASCSAGAASAVPPARPAAGHEVALLEQLTASEGLEDLRDVSRDPRDELHTRSREQPREPVRDRPADERVHPERPELLCPRKRARPPDVDLRPSGASIRALLDQENAVRCVEDGRHSIIPDGDADAHGANLQPDAEQSACRVLGSREDGAKYLCGGLLGSAPEREPLQECDVMVAWLHSPE
jgi:hypothetical protein